MSDSYLEQALALSCEHADPAICGACSRHEADKLRLRGEVERLRADIEAICARESCALDEYALVQFERDRLAAVLAETPEFGEAWEALGYDYGLDALEQVRLGWEMAVKGFSALRARAGLP